MKLNKTIHPQAIFALGEALAVVYWKKDELRAYLSMALNNSGIVSTLNWNVTKRETIKEMIDRMSKRPDIYADDLIELMTSVSQIEDLSHLKFWDDDGSKTRRAKEAITNLRNHTKGFIKIAQEKEQIEKRKKDIELSRKVAIKLDDELQRLKDSFIEISMNQNFQARGFQFERFLFDLFLLYDLDPKGSFKIYGEQIDGSFTFQGTDYLLEAKWKNQVNRGDLAIFNHKVETKFKTAVGLLITVDGITPEALDSNLKAIIIMDGADIMAILDRRVTLPDLLFRKRRHANETGNIYANFHHLL